VHKIINNCRNCKNRKLKNLFSLGNISFTGKFSNNSSKNVPKARINLVKCSYCNLVQLDRNFNPNYLYGKDYGYRSGINKTMTKHLTNTSYLLAKKTNLKKGDSVLDIASNDGTLLNSYKTKNIIKVGIDPIINKFKNYYSNIQYKINDFFSYEIIKRKKIKKKFKIITALSVFYDLEDPNKFLKDISKIIDSKDGVFLLENTDLLSIIKYNLFDTICHEHLEYYSVGVINKMAQANNLRVFNLSVNDINGGSVRFFICHKDAKYKTNHKTINSYIFMEKKLGLNNVACYKKFIRRVLKLKLKLRKLIKNIKIQKKTIHGYGASTKGNVLLQFFGLTNKDIKIIADRNILKNNFYTPGTKIRITTEEYSRKLKPDYYLVLPWHFKKEILIRERAIIKKGTKMIFPLPNLKIY
jgi:2-polyprenyl-3-methyl-5-hydroxy-6-metoxy-1,4-benzoquinol methylase